MSYLRLHVFSVYFVGRGVSTAAEFIFSGKTSHVSVLLILYTSNYSKKTTINKMQFLYFN